MTNPMITIHNVETGEILEREMNDQELAAYTSMQSEDSYDKAKAEAKATAKASAQTKLAALGLTPAEISALLA